MVGACNLPPSAVHHILARVRSPLLGGLIRTGGASWLMPFIVLYASETLTGTSLERLSPSNFGVLPCVLGPEIKIGDQAAQSPDTNACDLGILQMDGFLLSRLPAIRSYKVTIYERVCLRSTEQ